MVLYMQTNKMREYTDKGRGAYLGSVDKKFVNCFSQDKPPFVGEVEHVSPHLLPPVLPPVLPYVPLVLLAIAILPFSSHNTYTVLMHTQAVRYTVLNV